MVQAISVFGARVRGVASADDTPALAGELQRLWAAEGHPPVDGDGSGGRRARLLDRGRRVARRLPPAWQDVLRRAVRARQGR